MSKVALLALHRCYSFSANLQTLTPVWGLLLLLGQVKIRRGQWGPPVHRGMKKVGQSAEEQ